VFSLDEDCVLDDTLRFSELDELLVAVLSEFVVTFTEVWLPPLLKCRSTVPLGGREIISPLMVTFPDKVLFVALVLSVVLPAEAEEVIGA
jgi:hypothetical protein